MDLNLISDSNIFFVLCTVAWWLVRSSLERAFRVWALAGDTVLCSWARHLNLTVPLSTQEYKWVPANCWRNLTNCGWTSRGSRNTPSRFILQKLGISSAAMSQSALRLNFFFMLVIWWIWEPVDSSYTDYVTQVSSTSYCFVLVLSEWTLCRSGYGYRCISNYQM